MTVSGGMLRGLTRRKANDQAGNNEMGTGLLPP